MIDKYAEKLLNSLIDSYEKSKSHLGQNKRRQEFAESIEKLFPEYADETDFNSFNRINDTLKELEHAGLISLKIKSGEMYKAAVLNLQAISEIYGYLGRKPKIDTYFEAEKLLDEFSERNEILSKFCEEQRQRIAKNKTVRFVSSDGGTNELRNILTALDEIFKLETETFYRDFSARVFKDSKIFDGIAAKTAKIICEYSDFDDEETVLADLNLIKNPGHVYIKGNAVISFGSQQLDISQLSGDIAISSETLKNVAEIDVRGSKIFTIENLTSFHSFCDDNALIIYLGGYHNSLRRDFIKMIYADNPNKKYYHFGDIDAGGFYILEHLRRRTGIDFKPYMMDISVLQKYSRYTKPLTENDRKRLIKLSDGLYAQTINYMLENNCKLEQEAIAVFSNSSCFQI